jgi:4-hydroxybenzoate polyprenyltransferase
MVPLLVGFFEWSALYKYYTVNATSMDPMNFVFYWVGGFALFGFMTTLIREIIKDIEDFRGDSAFGRNTVPVVIGLLSARVVSVCLIIITVTFLYLAWYFFINDTITLIYVSSAIVLPLLSVIYILVFNSKNMQHHYARRIMKIVMLTGVLYSVVVKVILTWNLL